MNSDEDTVLISGFPLLSILRGGTQLPFVSDPCLKERKRATTLFT